jgi:hypothetical protein
MKKHQLFFFQLSLLVVAYVLASVIVYRAPFIEFWNSKSFFLSQTITIEKLRWFINVLPWYSLICFGCYCLSKLGMDIFSFNDCPSEIQKMTEVSAKLASVFHLCFCLYRALRGLEKT